MVDVFVRLIKLGLKTIDDVPIIWRQEVNKLLGL